MGVHAVRDGRKAGRGLGAGDGSIHDERAASKSSRQPILTMHDKTWRLFPVLPMLVFVALTVALARAQELPSTDPAAALSEALSAACRQNEQQFLRFLTADN